LSIKQKKYDICIVDDNFEQANILNVLIEYYGFKSTFFTNSETAYQHISKSKPKLIILDLMMPDIDGLKLCRMIKQDPKTADVKVIIYSGKVFDADRRRAMDLGADLFLTKPARSKVLLDSINSLINQN
jgi:CheY-like chemotaxis protein